MPKPSAGAARWNHETSASWSLIDTNGAATLSSRLAVTLSWAPTRKSANVTAPIQPAKSRSASANALIAWPLR
jgi:hypothetical protein